MRSNEEVEGEEIVIHTLNLYVWEDKKVRFIQYTTKQSSENIEDNLPEE